MLNVNFVPEDYVQSNESRRTNLMYLVLFVVVMVALAGSFVTIKVRQKAFAAREKLANMKMVEAKGALTQFEQLQEKAKVMKKAAVTTAELLDLVPKSVLLASLTNNLPSGVSLLRLDLVQKKMKELHAPTSKYNAVQAEKAAAGQPKISPEKLLETHISIEGVAPSDLQVADYIEKLSGSVLLNDVALVQSKEHKIEEGTFRQFKLTAMLKKDIHLTDEDISGIKVSGEKIMNSF